MNNVKKGIPVSEKPGAKEDKKKKYEGMEYNDFYNNRLQIPVDVASEAASSGLVLRWLNAKELQDNYGMHRSHWQPYKPKCLQTSKDNIFGVDPEGLMRRGDLILGCRDQELNSMHKEALRKRNETYSQFNKQVAKKLRKEARAAGVDAQITEGYYEDE